MEAETPLELAAFGLFKELGLAVLSSVLDAVLACQGNNAVCAGSAAQLSQGVLTLRGGLESRMVAAVQDYKPDTGVRSAVMRTARHLRSDIDRLMQDLSSMLAEPGAAIARVSELVHLVGHRSRMFAHQLGLHSWIRGLAVPGRGAPMFIIEDDYGSWNEMAETLIGNMVRNGPAEVSVAEIGARADAIREPALRAFPGMQYFGVIIDRKEGPNSEVEATAAAQQMAASLQEFSPRARVFFATSEATASAVPPGALDMVLLDASGSFEQTMQDLLLWQSRVKAGGIMAGRGLHDGSAPGVAEAVFKLRFSNDIHVGVGGTFWWYVEPEEG